MTFTDRAGIEWKSHVPTEAMQRVADRMGVPVERVKAVLDTYDRIVTDPRTRHVIYPFRLLAQELDIPETEAADCVVGYLTETRR